MVRDLIVVYNIEWRTNDFKPQFIHYIIEYCEPFVDVIIFVYMYVSDMEMCWLTNNSYFY